MARQLTEARKAANRRYQQSMAELKATMTKERAEHFREYAKSKDLSISKLINTALDEYENNNK